jgi:hypothetical protein
LLALDTKLPGGHCLTHVGREGRLQSFAILPGEEPSDVFAIANGHLVSKHRTTYPIVPRLVGDEHGNALLTLGFMLDAPKDLLASCATTAGRTLEDCECEFLAIYAYAARNVPHLINDRSGRARATSSGGAVRYTSRRMSRGCSSSHANATVPTSSGGW